LLTRARREEASVLLAARDFYVRIVGEWKFNFEDKPDYFAPAMGRGPSDLS
jgi:hypothetical protein